MERQLQALMPTRSADRACCPLVAPVRQPPGGDGGHGPCRLMRFASDAARTATDSSLSAERVIAGTDTARRSVASKGSALCAGEPRSDTARRRKRGTIIVIASAIGERTRGPWDIRVPTSNASTTRWRRRPLRRPRRRPTRPRSGRHRNTMPISRSLAARSVAATAPGFNASFRRDLFALDHRDPALDHRQLRATRGDLR